MSDAEKLKTIRVYGSTLVAFMNDGSKATGYPTTNPHIFIVRAGGGGGPTDPGGGLPGTCLPDYPNGEAPKECLLLWRGCYFSPTYFVRIVPAVLEYEADGSSITLNQGYRFLGVESDFDIGFADTSVNEDLASTTSDGTGNQWYQKGREANGSTPSAATPGTSNHGEYTLGAVDCSASDTGRRSAVFPKYGLEDNIMPSEPWHWAGVIDPTVTLPTLAEAMAAAGI